MNSIYPNVVDRALGNNIVSLTVGGAGLTTDKPALLNPKCQCIAEQGQVSIYFLALTCGWVGWMVLSFPR